MSVPLDADAERAQHDRSAEEPLHGGNSTPGVVRIADTIHRPAGSHSEFVGRLLRFLEREGLTIAPRYLGQDEYRRDMFSFIKGTTTSHPSERSEGAYVAGGAMLRRLHDITSTSPLADGHECVIHGDPGPFNMIFQNGMPICFIDWDAARPGRRLPDLAYMAWSWCIQSVGSVPVSDQASRLRRLRDGYGFTGDDYELLRAIIERQREIAAHAADQLIHPERFPGHHDHHMRAIAWADSDRELLERHMAVFVGALAETPRHEAR